MPARRPHGGFSRPIRLILSLVLALSTAAALPGAASSTEDRLVTLGAVADSLYEAAAYSSALGTVLDGLGIARSLSPPAAERITPWLLRAGRTQLKLSRLDEAEAFLLEALAIETASGGGPRFEELAVRCALATTLIELDRISDAVRMLEEAETLVERDGEADPEVLGDILSIQARLARRDGRLEEAVALFTRSVEINEQVWGADHPEVAAALANLADAHQVRGELDRAETLLRRAGAILEKAFGPGHARLGTVSNNLGVVLRRKGDFTGAREAYRRALAARIAAYGEDHPAVALTMVNLSALLQSQGSYAEPIRLLRRAVAIMEAAHGSGHTRTAWALSHLAQAERRQGNPVEAEKLFRRCLRIAEEADGSDPLDIVLYRIGVAQCLRDEGHLEEALEIFEQAAAAGSKLLGPGSHETARYRREVGVVLLLLGRLEEARAVFEASLATFEETLGGEHPAVNRCLAGLTVADLLEGNLAPARLYAERNLAAAERAFGEKGLRRSLLMMLAVEVAGRDWEEAVRQGIRAARIAETVEEDLFQVSSDREILRYATHHRRVLGALLAACQATPELPDTTLAAVFQLVAQQHGRVVDRFARRRQLVELATAPPVARRLYETYMAATERLASRIVRGPRGDPERYSALLAQARREKTEAERALAEVSERFRQQIEAGGTGRSLSPEEVARRLEPGAVLIEFIRFPVLSAGTGLWQPGATSLEGALFSGGGERYGAFLLRAFPEGDGRVELIDLGGARGIDSLIVEYRRAVTTIRTGSRPSAREEAEFRTVSRLLHDRIWAPLAGRRDTGRALEGTDEAPLVFLVPTSKLHLVDLGTLLTPEGDLLIERWSFHLLSSVRDLFRPERSSTGPLGLLSVGNPDATGLTALCADLGRSETPLPGAETEAREIAELFGRSTGEPVTVLTGGEATEAAVKVMIPRIRLLHLAAHGFFCEEDRSGEGGGDRLGIDPLVRCGIVLAPGAGGEDGLLTAQEIVVRDLRGLDWVALSACNSGLGPLVPGEGLFGLRRAFEIAGASTVVMALWRVGDATAKALMEGIYRRRLEGRSTAAALRLAQLERMREQRRRFHRIHPALWGGIVAEGEWR